MPLWEIGLSLTGPVEDALELKVGSDPDELVPEAPKLNPDPVEDAPVPKDVLELEAGLDLEDELVPEAPKLNPDPVEDAPAPKDVLELEAGLNL